MWAGEIVKGMQMSGEKSKTRKTGERKMEKNIRNTITPSPKLC